MWAPKTAVFLVGVISSVLLMIIFTFPFSHDFVTTTILSVWIRVHVFLVPPCLLVTVNFIIFVIWILSERHHHHQSIDRKQKWQKDFSVEISSSVVQKNNTQDLFFTETQLQFPSMLKSETKSDLSCVTTDDEVTSLPAVVTSPTIRKQKAVVKRIPNPEPPQPTVEEEVEVEKTMDATWETIMMASPASRQFKRSETWKAPKEAEKVKSPKVVGVSGRAEMRKSLKATFNDSRRRAPVLRKDVVVVGNDELERRSDDFIKKTYDHLRLQRQESHQRYIDMVNRGMTP